MTADVVDILSLAARYSHLFAARAIDEWLECWTEEGYFERFGTHVRAQGHEALGDMVRSLPFRGRHVNSDHVVTVDGDAATHRCYCVFIDPSAACAPLMAGVYEDQLERTAEGWKFAARVFSPDFIAAEIPKDTLGASLLGREAIDS
jgi:hypothetical protein